MALFVCCKPHQGLKQLCWSELSRSEQHRKESCSFKVIRIPRLTLFSYQKEELFVSPVSEGSPASIWDFPEYNSSLSPPPVERAEVLLSEQSNTNCSIMLWSWSVNKCTLHVWGPDQFPFRFKLQKCGQELICLFLVHMFYISWGWTAFSSQHITFKTKWNCPLLY